MVHRGSELQHTRTFQVGAFEFSVDTATEDDRRLVEELFRDVPPASGRTGSPSILALIREDDAGGSWLVASPRTGERNTGSIDSALDLLIADITLSALDAEPESLHLHAAAATKDGRAVIIAAERNTGKTTTVAHLAARGWSVVTDEAVRLPANGDFISGFPKPLSIKPDGIGVVDHLSEWMIPPLADGPAVFRFVPIGASGAHAGEGGDGHLVILLRRPLDWQPTNGCMAFPLHPADAVVALMGQTLDAERFGAAAERLARLAVHSLCYEVVPGTPSETADEIEALFQREVTPPLDVVTLPPSDAFSPGVVSLTIGDRVVVHDTDSGRILALDAGAAQVWGTLGGWSVDPALDVDGPVIGPFVAQLRALGVLAGAA